MLEWTAQYPVIEKPQHQSTCFQQPAAIDGCQLRCAVEIQPSQLIQQSIENGFRTLPEALWDCGFITSIARAAEPGGFDLPMQRARHVFSGVEQQLYVFGEPGSDISLNDMHWQGAVVPAEGFHIRHRKSKTP